MVKFTKLIAHNCFAYEYLEFDFCSGIHSIVGTNGASKTTILLALAQGLFNKNPKGTRVDEVSNRITGQPYEIQIYFEKAGLQYKITNSRKRGSISIEVDGKDISRKTIPRNLELIREIIGDAYESFIGQTYQASDSTLDLLEESSDSARKEFVNKVLKFNELDDLLETSKGKLKTLKAVLKQLQESQKQWQERIVPIKEVGKTEPTTKLEQQVKLLDKAKDAALWYLGEMQRDKDEQEQKRKAYEMYLQNLNLLEKVTNELAEIQPPDKTEEQATKALEAARIKLASIDAVIIAANKGLAELKEPELTCSRCHQPVDAANAIKIYSADKAKFTEQFDTATYQAALYKDLIENLHKQVRTWEKIGRLKTTINTLTAAVVEVEKADESTFQEACAKLEFANNSYKEAVAEHAEAVRLLNEANRNNDLIKMQATLNEQIKDSNDSIILKLEKYSEDIKETEKRIDLLEHWIRILGPNGYRVHIMSNFLQLLNQTMDKYATIISGGRIRCTFFVTPEGKIDFTVIDPDKKVPFANWSKGEQARVKLACLFSVIELLEVMGSASYNVLVLDEIFSALDDEGKEGLFEVLSYLRAAGKCIYTISHTPLVNPVVFDSCIQVVKENGLARIV